MLVTGISFIRMSYSFVSCSVIYLLFLNWHNVRFLYWITFNYMSECLNYPNLTTLSSLVRRYSGWVWRETGLRRDVEFCWPRGMRGTWWAFILHKLFAVSVCKSVRLHPDGCVTLGLSISALLCGLWLAFGQRCCSLTIWIYFALIFQCRHLIPAKSRAGQVTGFLSALILAHQPMFVKVDWFVLDNSLFWAVIVRHGQAIRLF